VTSLADLRDRRLFTDRRSGDVEIYEYHPLFRQFLHKHASSEWGPARTAELIGDSADALASAGHEEAALELYLDAARWGGSGPADAGAGAGLHGGWAGWPPWTDG
jgi:ATP/maltotriose-dependent transcriptional regulator MalT